MSRVLRFSPYDSRHRSPAVAREARDQEWARLRERRVQAHRYTEYQYGVPIYCIRYPRGADT